MRSIKFIPLFVFAMMFAVACGIQAPKQVTLQDAIATSAASVESLADQVADMCGHAMPRGECRPDALISTATKEWLRSNLQEALDATNLARIALAADRSHEAADELGRAQSLLVIVRNEIARAQN